MIYIISSLQSLFTAKLNQILPCIFKVNQIGCTSSIILNRLKHEFKIKSNHFYCHVQCMACCVSGSVMLCGVVFTCLKDRVTYATESESGLTSSAAATGA